MKILLLGLHEVLDGCVILLAPLMRQLEDVRGFLLDETGCRAPSARRDPSGKTMGECRYHDMVDERLPLLCVDNPTRFRCAEIEGLRDDRMLAWQTGERLNDTTT